MNELMIFEGHEVEVFEFEGQILFNPKHVAEILEISDINSSTRNFNSKQIIKLKNSDVHNLHIRKLNNAGENFLTESGVYKLVFKSHKPNAEKFTDWIADEVLPSIRKTGSYSTNGNSEIEQGLIAAKFIADDMRVNDASRLLMYENLCKDFNIPTGFLPKYEHNRSREMKAPTHLLKENNCELKTAKFNKLLIKHGFIEIKERPSSSGDEMRKYKSLTETGLKYGENAVSPKNQRETQPLYYADTFMELYEKVTK